MTEQRLTTRLSELWERLRGDASMPLFEKLNTSAIEDLWHNCLVLKTEPAVDTKRAYTYTHCGRSIREAIGKDLTGQRMAANMKFFPGANIIKRIDDVAKQASPCPLLDDGQFINEQNKVVKYRACLLAFGTGATVSHVVIGVSWRAF